MTQSTINWINSGFHGAPLFIERPDAFFKDIAKYEIKKLVNTIGYDSLRFPFGKSVAINLINSFKRPFARNAEYSLNKVIRDPDLLERYQNDFSVGGWTGFFINTRQQNNYIGFYLMTQEELARSHGGPNSEAQKVRDVLQQGRGFLSPQKCPTNKNYNNLKNQFNQPSFKSSIKPPVYNCSASDDSNREAARVDACITEYNSALAVYELDYRAEYNDWSIDNACPGGLVNTTPGSVVAEQIFNATGTTWRQSELAQALGNNLAAIFDALLNKLFSTGLNALSSKINGIGNDDKDDFNYYGHTLGSPVNNGTNPGTFNWNGPDEEVILTDFKKEVQAAIDNGNKELKFINNVDGNAPGFLQLFETVILRTQELDTCTPGPNFGWEDRVDREVQSKGSTPQVTSVARSYKNSLPQKMKSELPSAVTYLSTVNSVKTTNEKLNALTERENKVREMLVTLESIKGGLSALSTQPKTGSEEEKTMVRLRERFNPLLGELPTPTSVSNAQNGVDDLKDKLANTSTLITRCTSERAAKGWSNPGGPSSVLGNGTTVGTTVTEKDAFCTSFVSTTLSCDVIYQTNISDYKIQDITNPDYIGTTGGVVIPENRAPKLGTCIKGLVIKRNITQNECSSTYGGVWVENQQ